MCSPLRCGVQEFKTIVERNISGKGVLRVPSDVKKRRLTILYCSVIRKPKSEYLNLHYSPGRSVYAWLTFWRNGYVIGTETVEFPQQSFDGITDITSQNLIAIKCAYEGILQSFANLVVGLSQTPGGVGLQLLSIEDKIKDYEYLDLVWDEVRVVCYADTAINMKLVYLKHDACAEDKDKPRKPPPPPPPPPPVPPGTPLTNISNPYGDDDNFTNPYTGDNSNDDKPKPDKQCQAYKVVVTITSDAFAEKVRSFEVTGYGEFEDPVVRNVPESGNVVYLPHRAGYPGACGDMFDDLVIVIGPFAVKSAEITSSEEITTT